MSQTNLTLEEKNQIIDALNKDLEPSDELLPKLFPLVFEKQDKFDVKALERAKIPTLEYAGKRSKATILAEGTAGIGAAPLQIVRTFGEVKDNDWKNLIVQGDNLQFLKTCYRNIDPLIKDKVKGKVKLIYIDPPFGTGDEYGGKEGQMSYSAKLEGSGFIEANRERLIYLHSLLSDDGLIFVRLDYHFGHYIKIILDDLFDKTNFVNEIVINRGKQRLGGTKKYSTATDSLYVYSKTSNYIFFGFKRERYASEAKGTNMLMKGERHPRERIFKDPNGEDVVLIPPNNSHWKFIQKKIDEMYKKNVIYLAKSRSGLKSGIMKKLGNELIPVDYVPSFNFDDDKTVDSNWTDISGYSQDTGYPTENSETLLERVIKTIGSESTTIMDVFGGSGTTAAVAEKLGHRWITCDFGKHSIYTIQKRILNIADSKKLGKDIKNGEKYGEQPKPFCVVSSGAYDFEHVMDLKKNKERYIDFVLGLFQLARDDQKAARFKLSNIYSVKDNNPVEVYPVWNDEYLKDVRIDENYLQQILDQTGGRLRGDYYIITPETCTNVGDMSLNNQDGKQINFHILSFPYKILEDISQKLELQEQPSSSDNINNLITSTSFYFNEDVEIELKRVSGGLKLCKFDTKILDGLGNRFEGLSGVAMLLVDLNYVSGKPFDMDVAVYAKEISDDGTFKIEGLTPSVGVIAIDKHGNESKPYSVK